MEGLIHGGAYFQNFKVFCCYHLQFAIIGLNSSLRNFQTHDRIMAKSFNLALRQFDSQSSVLSITAFLKLVCTPLLF